MNYINLKGNYKYTMILQKPNGSGICEVSEDYLDNIEIKMDEVSSLSLTIPKTIPLDNGLMIENPMYKEIIGERLIEVNEKYTFVIKNVEIKEEAIGDKKKVYKTVKAYSREKKLERRNVTLTGNVYQLISDEVNINQGILEIFAEETKWKIGYVDPDAKIEHINGGSNNKYRYFEPMNKAWSNFLREDVQSAFDCVVKFNTLEKTIDVIARDNLGEHKGLYLSLSNFLKSLNKRILNEQVITRLEVQGKNTENGYVSIEYENPLGTEYIENFDYMISQGNMSDELIVALNRYKILIDEKQLEWQLIKNDKSALDQQRIVKENELLAKQEELKGKNALLSAYIKAGDDVNRQRIIEEIDALKLVINNLLQVIMDFKMQIQEKQNLINDIAVAINKPTATDNQGQIFTEELLEELDEFIITEAWSNDYFLTEFGLYNASLQVLEQKSKPPIEFDLDSLDFLKAVRHPDGWDNILWLGDFITIDTDEGLNDDCRLIGWNHNPKSKQLQLYFTNKERKLEFGSGYANVGRKATDTKSVLDMWKHIWNTSSDTHDFVSQIRQQGLDLSANLVRGRGFRNKIDISEVGIFIIDADDENNQIYIGSSLLAFTSDGWQTSNLAMDEEGVYAKHLVGQIILGENLFIADNEGTFEIRGNKLTIKDRNEKVRCILGEFESNKFGIQLFDKNGEDVVLSEDGIVNCYQFMYGDNLDENNPIEIPFVADDGVKTIKKAILSLKLEEFRTHSKSVASGGQTTTTTANGGYAVTTSENGGGYSNTITSLQQSWYNNVPDGKLPVIPESGYSVGWIGMASFDHSHRVGVTISPHSHQFTLLQHLHTLYLDPHVHDIVYGIFKNTQKPTNVNVYINDVLIAQNINGNTAIDIAQYLQLNNTNIIKITSNNIGRINASLFVKGFMAF